MQMHVAAKGNEFMMEHFGDLANAGKMDGETLKNALNAERDYAVEKAMMPPKASGQQPEQKAPKVVPARGRSDYGFRDSALHAPLV
jgi:hypothetical protein